MAHRASRSTIGMAVQLATMSALVASAVAQQGTAVAAQRTGRQILVSIPDRKLAVLANGKVLRTFPVAVGAPASPSPTGEFRIVSRLKDPTYYHPGVVIAPGASNPIGPRWVGLNKKTYAIHGTNDPKSIGQAASHGCIRMRNKDVEQFFEMVRVGDAVDIRASRDDELAEIFGRADSSVVAAIQALPAGAGQ